MLLQIQVLVGSWIFVSFQSNVAGIWTMVLTWTPNATQSGPQGFCAGAIDNSSLQSDPWCITYLVDYTSPNLIRPTVVQGSASPVGTVFANQSTFSITGNFTF